MDWPFANRAGQHARHVDAIPEDLLRIYTHLLLMCQHDHSTHDSPSLA